MAIPTGTSLSKIVVYCNLNLRSHTQLGSGYLIGQHNTHLLTHDLLNLHPLRLVRLYCFLVLCLAGSSWYKSNVVIKKSIVKQILPSERAYSNLNFQATLLFHFHFKIFVLALNIFLLATGCLCCLLPLSVDPCSLNFYFESIMAN